jgi:hypothetical protein
MTLRIPPLWLLVLAGIAMLAYSRSQTRHRMPRVLGDPCVDRFSFNRIKVALPMISIRRCWDAVRRLGNMGTAGMVCTVLYRRGAKMLSKRSKRRD